MLDLSERTLNRTIFNLAWPAILENLLQLSVFVIDGIMVGPLGTQAFAAVGQSSMILYSTSFLFSGVGVATAAIVARNLGRRDTRGASEVACQGLLLGGIIGILLTILGLRYGRFILKLLGTTPDVIDPVERYLAIIFVFSLFRSVLAIAGGLLRASGDTRTPMWATGATNLFNVVANWVLIFGVGPFPRMGTDGAALATGLSFAVGTPIVLFRLFRPDPVHSGNSGGDRGDPVIGYHGEGGPDAQAVQIDLLQDDPHETVPPPDHLPGFSIKGQDLLHVNGTLIKTILRIALPNLGEQVLLQGGHWTFLWMVTGLGTVSLAAHFMAIRVESLAFMPAFGLSVAVIPLVGQGLGANRSDLAELAVKRTAIIGIVSMVGLGGVFVVIPGIFVRLFSPTPEVYDVASICVRISALELPTCALLMICMGAMRGAGDTVSPMIVTLFGTIFLRVGMVYLLAIRLGLGLPGVWYGTAVDWGLRALISYVLFRMGRWKRVKF
ncbi:MAG: MATE family efflux transporter [Candidatus Latescibacteria bacterium]|nr:MATE family efflux transporter [Candidatus Latescibacterota bacterium]